MGRCPKPRDISRRDSFFEQKKTGATEIALCHVTVIGVSIMQTICAFANEPGLGGGYLLLGIAEPDASQLCYCDNLDCNQFGPIKQIYCVIVTSKRLQIEFEAKAKL